MFTGMTGLILEDYKCSPKMGHALAKPNARKLF